MCRDYLVCNHLQVYANCICDMAENALFALYLCSTLTELWQDNLHEHFIDLMSYKL